MVAATPSGGWLQSSPVIPELGFMLSSRAQMFWLEPGLPASLEPGKRPRTTLTPSLALRDGKPSLAFGSPGGDQQEQWQLQLFLRHVHHGMNLQEAIEQPMFHTAHFPSSFYPRERKPGHLLAEEASGPRCWRSCAAAATIWKAPAWSVGRLVAASRRPRRPAARRRHAAADAGLCGGAGNQVCGAVAVARGFRTATSLCFIPAKAGVLPIGTVTRSRLAGMTSPFEGRQSGTARSPSRLSRERGSNGTGRAVSSS